MGNEESNVLSHSLVQPVTYLGSREMQKLLTAGLQPLFCGGSELIAKRTDRTKW